MQMANTLMRFSHVCEELVYTRFAFSDDDDYFCANQKETIKWNFQCDLNSCIAYECLTTQATYIHFIYTKDFSVFTCAKSQYIPDLDSVLSSTAPH